jgi:tRNA-splicing ligase RtcB
MNADNDDKDLPLVVRGVHDENTVSQMWRCLGVGSAIKGVLCADGHLGYAQPVGGVIAYDRDISISGVGFDIACGNMAVKTDMTARELSGKIEGIAKDIANKIDFGVGGSYSESRNDVGTDMFDDAEAWKRADVEELKDLAFRQLGTVGGGNHYVDVFVDDEDGHVWVGVHFGSRGLGHKTATKYLKLAGGKDGMNVAPALVSDDTELGERYFHAMELA